MAQVAAFPTQLVGWFVHLVREARSTARRAGGVLVWASQRAEPGSRGWAVPRPGWVWAKPAARVWACGAGEAWRVEVAGPSRFREAGRAWGQLARRVVAAGPLRPVAFAGFAFGRSDTELWEGFPEGLLAVPRVLRLRVGGADYLALACVLGPGDEEDQVDRTLRALHEPDEAEPTPAVAHPIRQLPSAGRWMAEVARAEAACRAGALQKVVLARCVELATETSPETVLQRLAQRYPTCTVFAAAHPDAVFLGATPETLVRVRRGVVSAQALAGTACRGATAEEDARLRSQLCASAKEAREHELVAQHVHRVLRPVCAQLRRGSREVVTLPNVLHLRTRFSGRLLEGTGVLDVAGRLHPTPAVAGLPVEAAGEWVRRHEAMPRGWYAGALGWVDAQGDGELVVCIRSAVLRAGRAWAFAGCGIVGGSQPDREYEESQAKLRPVLEAFGVQEP